MTNLKFSAKSFKTIILFGGMDDFNLFKYLPCALATLEWDGMVSNFSQRFLPNHLL